MNQTEFPPNWPSSLGGDTSTPKQRESRKLNWAKFMVTGMIAQVKYLESEGAIDTYAVREAFTAMQTLQQSIAFQEKMLDIESEYRRRFGVL